MELSQGRTFTKAAPGMYLGTIVDVVDMPNVQTAYGLKNRVRIHWVLAGLNGAPYIDKEGKVVEAVGMWNANMGPKAELPKKLAQILGGAPPVLTSSEQLEQLLIGRSNVLILVQTDNPKNPQDPYINVDSIAPLQPGMPAPPPIPPNYVRFKNRPKTQVGPNGQPVQTFASPQAAYAATQPPVAPGYGYPPVAAAQYVPPPSAPVQVAPAPYTPPAAPPAAYVPPPQAAVNLNAGAPVPDPNARQPF